MGKVIVIGATSGIGRELAKIFSQQGETVGIVGRRAALLTELFQELPNKTYIRQIDIDLCDEAIHQMEELLEELGGVDVIVVSAATGYLNPELDWPLERKTIDTNVAGFAAMCNVAMKQFAKQGYGHLVGISSVAAIRGNGVAPAYSASKAFVSNYLEGLRLWAYSKMLPVTVTEIQPGYVDTRMAKGEGLFWVASAEKAAQQIYRAIIDKRSHAYVTGRWRLFAWLMKGLPDFVMKILVGRQKNSKAGIQ